MTLKTSSAFFPSEQCSKNFSLPLWQALELETPAAKAGSMEFP